MALKMLRHIPSHPTYSIESERARTSRINMENRHHRDYDQRYDDDENYVILHTADR